MEHPAGPGISVGATRRGAGAPSSNPTLLEQARKRLSSAGAPDAATMSLLQVVGPEHPEDSSRHLQPAEKADGTWKWSSRCGWPGERADAAKLGKAALDPAATKVEVIEPVGIVPLPSGHRLEGGKSGI